MGTKVVLVVPAAVPLGYAGVAVVPPVMLVGLKKDIKSLCLKKCHG